MVKIYCLKKLTENINPKIIKKENGRLMERSKCASCGVNKARFIKMPVYLFICFIQYYIFDNSLY